MYAYALRNVDTHAFHVSYNHIYIYLMYIWYIYIYISQLVLTKILVWNLIEDLWTKDRLVRDGVRDHILRYLSRFHKLPLRFKEYRN